ncbi:glycoside hydrolase family 18 protein [Infundibulicybe gibba]|nr:glycoside hydrolase family 18 protein [Infundibulicybe gibba]
MTHQTTLLFLYAFITFALAAPSCGLVPPTNKPVRDVTGGSATSDDVLAMAWYPSWLGSELPPEKVSWSKYSALTFAFAITTPDVNTISLDSAGQQLLPSFVDNANKNNVSALLSIGGWTGSQYFSTAVATAANRTLFVQSVLGLVSKYKLDGIDFDWEYPNKQGVGCNTISPSDSANFLSFLQELRASPAGANMLITAAVGITPFAGSDGTPMTDVSGFYTVLDHIAIMAYDIWGSFSTGGVGPNAPLNDTCAPTKAGSAVSAVNAWTAAKFQSDKVSSIYIMIALGVAAYGHSFHVDNSAAINGSTLAAYPPFDKNNQPKGDKDDGGPGVDQCGAPVGTGGIFNFWGLISGGFLTSNGTAAAGINYRFDTCSQTPYVYNPTTQVMVSYDDATSFAAKGKFINDMGLKGFAMWHAAGDSNDILIDSISNAMGIEQECS